MHINNEEQVLKILIITVSDRAHAGVYEDLSGPAIENVLYEKIEQKMVIEKKIVADDRSQLSEVIENSSTVDFILTTGGTGLSKRDITPDVCQSLCERSIPGIAEMLRQKSYEETPNAVLSRGYAGIKNKTIIINFPGSVRGAVFCAKAVAPLMGHAKKMLRGEGH